MAAATRAHVFVETLQKSELFTEQEYHDLLYLIHTAGLHPQDNKGVATWCVQQGYLTKFQAEQLLRGKWRNFLINHKYKVLEPLGQGGMGAVFRAEHISLGKEVAVKILPTELTRNPAALQRFLREAQALAALDHPNIVQAHDVDEHRGQYFIVMACIEGRTLLDLVRQSGPLTVVQAAHYIVQACRGLQHAHEAGWIHRDLKPGNLILDRHGMVKIMDFGLARLATSDGSVTRDFKDCNILGSPDYISPEQAMNNPEIDGRADIYSLGATLYFLLTGQGPFEGEQLLQKLLAHQIREPEEVNLFRGDVPAELNAIMKRMMAKKPAARYATPAEVILALKPWADKCIAGSTQTTPPVLRSTRTVRIPRVASAPETMRVADPLGNPAAMDTQTDAAAFAPTIDTDVPTEPEEELVPEGLSRRTKSILAVVVAAVVLAVIGTVLTMWLLTPADRTTRLAKVDQYGRQKHWEPAAAILTDLLRESPENSKERKEIYSRVRTWMPTVPHLLVSFPTDAELNRIACTHYLKESDVTKAMACLQLAANAAPEANDAVLWHRVADSAVLQRQWTLASQALEQAFRAKSDNPEWSRNRGFVYLAAGDLTNYHRVCQETLAKFGGKGRQRKDKIEVVYLCGQAPLPPEFPLKDVLQLGKELTAEKKRDGNTLFRCAVVLYRAGRWQECFRVITEAKSLEKGWPDHRLCDPLLAMVQFQLGYREEAQRLLAEYRTWAKSEMVKRAKTPFVPLLSTWWDSLAMDNLWREAAPLIEGTARS